MKYDILAPTPHQGWQDYIYRGRRAMFEQGHSPAGENNTSNSVELFHKVHPYSVSSHPLLLVRFSDNGLSLDTCMADFPLRIGEQWRQETLTSAILWSNHYIASRKQAGWLVQCKDVATWKYIDPTAWRSGQSNGW